MKKFNTIVFLSIVFVAYSSAASISTNRSRYFLSQGGSLNFKVTYNTTGTDGNIDRFPTGAGCVGDSIDLGGNTYERNIENKLYNLRYRV